MNNIKIQQHVALPLTYKYEKKKKTHVQIYAILNTLRTHSFHFQWLLHPKWLTTRWDNLPWHAWARRATRGNIQRISSLKKKSSSEPFQRDAWCCAPARPAHRSQPKVSPPTPPPKKKKSTTTIKQWRWWDLYRFAPINSRVAITLRQRLTVI